METKGLTCKIPLDLHNQISEEIRETESNMSKFIEMVIREHYQKGEVNMTEKGKTLAFQVSEELFQRVKEYLEAYEKAYHRRLTQKEFVVGLIEQALEEAEEEFEAARAAEYEEQDIQRRRPLIRLIHHIFREIADIAEHCAQHHADQQMHGDDDQRGDSRRPHQLSPPSSACAICDWASESRASSWVCGT